MKVKFQIEFVNKDRRPYYLIARYLTQEQPFSLNGTPYLNNFKIKPVLIKPRASDKDGNPRVDLYIFYPVNGDDIKTLNTGTIVELTTS